MSVSEIRCKSEAMDYMTPRPAKDNYEKFESILGKTICNHEKYEITFKRDLSSKVVCDITKGNMTYSNIPLIKSRDPEQPNIHSPYSYTFYPQRNCVVFGSYGLKGGIDSDDEKVEQSSDEKVEQTIHVLKIANAVLKLAFSILGLVFVITGNKEMAKKCFKF